MRIPPRFALLLISALAAGLPLSARATSMDAVVVREALELAWNDVARPGLSLEVRYVPHLAHHGVVAQVEAVFPESTLRAGPRAIPMNLRVEGRIVARGLANVVVRESLTVWVAARAIERGDRVTAADLQSESRVYDREPRQLFEGPGDGTWIASHDLEVGRVLRPRDLDREPDIAAGDPVILVSKAGDATVTVAGRARRSGSVGDTILVLNPITNAIVRARIVDRSTAVLVAPGGERSQS